MPSRSALVILFIALVFSFSNTSCKKEQLLTSGGEVKFSLDTLTFDTVFTSYGSYTDWVKIFNPQNQKITVSSVRLENGNSSLFHLNVNGIEGNAASNIEVAANDSFYVFATVNINPDDENNPFLITDRLIVTMNGKEFSIPMIAYGQNAYYIDGNVDGHIQTETWKIDKPYVIVHSGLVDSGHTLTIPAGCRVYMNADSRLYVQGSLKVEGTKEKPVVFQGGRLDRKYFGYEGYPGEWGGIYFFRYSFDNKINYAVIKNAGNTPGAGYPAAITLEPDLVLGDTQLVMRNTVIENSLGYGILSIGGTLKAENCLINTCGAQGLAIVQGGEYEINNCDFVTYSTDKIAHTKEPTLAALNYLDIGNNQYIAGPLKGIIRNCVIWGSIEEEIVFDKVNDYGYDLRLENCLMRKKETVPSYVTFSNCIFNQDPKFTNTEEWNFKPLEGSPLINNGVANGLSIDLDNKTRDGKIDIGCYEF
jgi:hypothetical protein